MLSCLTGSPAPELIFQCDIAPNSRKWLALPSSVQPTYFFADLVQRSFTDTTITAKTLGAKEITLTREDVDLDLYVAGFPCTPFSDKGKRGGWQDPAPLRARQFQFSSNT